MPRFKKDQIPFLFKNDHFLVVDKPAGMLSVPSRAGESDTRRCLVRELEAENVIPVHRLDVEVSGLLLFAKTAESHRAANGWFEQRLIHKVYEAWSEGAVPSEQAFEWHSRLLRGKRRAYESPHGKPSTTRAVFVGLYDRDTLRWKLEPLTGRSHQLRFELAKHGYPILGDRLYGATSEFAPDAIALRAVRLDFSGCPQASEFGLPTEIAAPSISELRMQ